MWAVQVLGEELLRDACPGLEVQQADLGEEPSSTQHPGVESERREELVMVKVRAALC